MSAVRSSKSALQGDSAALAPPDATDSLGTDPLGNDSLGTDPLSGSQARHLGEGPRSDPAATGVGGDGPAGATPEPAAADAPEAHSHDEGDASVAGQEPAARSKAGAGASSGDGPADGDDAREGDPLPESRGEGVDGGDVDLESIDPAMRQRGMKMPLPESPIAVDDDGDAPPVQRPPPPKGLETFDVFGMKVPNPFYSKTQLTSEALGDDGQLAVNATLATADTGLGVLGGVAGKVLPALLKGGYQMAAKNAGLAKDVGKMLGKGAASNAVLYLGPLTLVAGAVATGVGIHNAINEGPGLFNTLANNDLSGFTRAAAALRGVAIAASILSGLAGMVSGAAATAGLILLLTGYGAAFVPFLKKLAIVSGLIGLGLTAFGVVLTVIGSLLQKIGALDDGTRMAGLLESAEAARDNAEALVDTSSDADEHESGAVREMLATLDERSAPPDASEPFDVMRAHAEAHDQAEAAANVATGVGAHLSEEDTPLQAALSAHEGSAEHIDMVLGVAREKQALLQEQHTTLTDVTSAVNAAGGALGKLVSGKVIFDPLIGLLTSPLVAHTAQGEGPLATWDFFGVKVVNQLAIASAQAALNLGHGVRDVLHGPSELVHDAFQPIRPLPHLLDERDFELGAAIQTLRAARDSHDEAGEILADRQARMQDTFGLAQQEAQAKLGYRDALGPRIESSFSSLERDVGDDGPVDTETPPA